MPPAPLLHRGIFTRYYFVPCFSQIWMVLGGSAGQQKNLVEPQTYLSRQLPTHYQQRPSNR